MSVVHQSFLVVVLFVLSLATNAHAHLCEASFFADGVALRATTFSRGSIRRTAVETLDQRHRSAVVMAEDWLTADGFSRQVAVLGLRSPSRIEQSLIANLREAENNAVAAKNMLALSERQVLWAKYSKELEDAEEVVANYTERIDIASAAHTYREAFIESLRADVIKSQEVAVNARLRLSQLNAVSLDSVVRKARQEAASDLLSARLAVLDYLKTHDVPVVYVKYYVEGMAIVFVDFNNEFLILDPLVPEANFWSM